MEPGRQVSSILEREDSVQNRVTINTIRERKAGPKLTMVTAYDAPMATIVDQAGVDMLLVGDSLADNVLGFADTLSATVDVMVHHTAAVTRTQPRALVLGDMPWLSYHVSTAETIQNAGRLIREGGADAVKLEGGSPGGPRMRCQLVGHSCRP